MPTVHETAPSAHIAAFAIAVGFFLIKNLFEPSEEDETKDAWGWLGVLMVFLAISALVYFQYH